jgi:hypothetical protein
MYLNPDYYFLEFQTYNLVNGWLNYRYASLKLIGFVRLMVHSLPWFLKSNDRNRAQIALLLNQILK